MRARARATYMHVDDLAIALLSIHDRCDEHECVSPHEIPYASLVLAAAVAGVGCEVEFEGEG